MLSMSKHVTGQEEPNEFRKEKEPQSTIVLAR